MVVLFSNLFFIPMLGLIGAIVGGLLSYLGSRHAYKDQLKYDIKNIAKAIDLDLQTIKKSSTFSTAYHHYTTDPSTILHTITLDVKPHISPNPLYNKETGIYLLYKRDITKLNYDLALNIYEFYNDLFAIENYRLLLLKNPNFILSIHKNPNPVSPIDNECMSGYPKMTKLIIKCWDNIPKIRTALKAVIDG